MFPDFHFEIPHKDHIFSNKHPQHLFNIEGLKCGVYSKISLKRRRHLLNKKKSYIKFENFVTVSFQITVKKNYYDTKPYIFQSY